MFYQEAPVMSIPKCKFHFRFTSRAATRVGAEPATLCRMRRRVLGIVLCLLAAVLPLAIALPSAQAHAELRQSSPAAGATVGGEFHQVAMFFTGLDAALPQQARLFDPAGNLVREGPSLEDQQMVLSIDPLTVPGEYLVTYEVTGIDGDFTAESFTFFYEPDADEPDPLTIEIYGDDGFDVINFVLLLVGAGLAAFLVHRVVTAWREDRAASRAAPSP